MKALSTFLFVLIGFQVLAQTKITGQVRDQKGDVVPLANVILQDTYDGTSADVEGKFEFTTTETGKQILVVKFMGYKDFVKEIDVMGKTIYVDAELEEAINELSAVTISAGAFMASDEKRRTVFRAIDIATTAGATADIAGALNTLPGTQKVGESGRLFVRGGDGNETRTFIDGMVVLDAYSPAGPNTPSRGRFLPFMFKGTSFSTGGYSAEFGQALSSALALDSKDNAELTRTDIGILSVGGDIAHTQAWKGGSAAGKIQYTNIRPYFNLVEQDVDWKKMPSSLETSAAFRQHLGKSGMIKFYGNFNQTDYALYNHPIDNPQARNLYDLTNKYRYMNGFFKNVLNENWSVRGGVSYTYQQNNALAAADNIIETQKGLHAKTVLEGALSEKIELKSGVEMITRTYDQDFFLAEGADYTRGFEETVTAVFTEADVYTSNSFVTRAGARLEYNALSKDIAVDPRLSLAYKTGDNSQVSLAYGKFRQSPNDLWLRLNKELNAEKADHYILNFQHIADDRTFRAEAYYKKYNDLVKFAGDDASDLNNNGNGFAKGFELFWRDNKTVKNVDYWFSYSFLDTERNYLQFPKASVPNFASRHNFSVVYKHFIKDLKSQAGLTYSYASGRAYNNPNQVKFNDGKTPHYSDLSFNWSYLPRPYVIIHFSCTNLLGRDNIFGYEYASTPDAEGVYNGRSIRLSAPRFLFLGIFITLSKEKSINQLPSL
ncbi:TonB-dependent receptor [Pseudochryseolinea flava]|uniref:TonB-dependent receptor n=1 Tax=Pseudochryseolinea flava TaxID=2059302 RepID=A0A364XWJ2_9BACT|nr:TonB-dependent receptor [Pseudochryseolinea flava]RAV98089.1 TonB-dependent receptor [Pseudochryseolinea flava]